MELQIILERKKQLCLSNQEGMEREEKKEKKKREEKGRTECLIVKPPLAKIPSLCSPPLRFKRAKRRRRRKTDRSLEARQKPAKSPKSCPPVASRASAIHRLGERTLVE
jgi:hypothetical protein